MEKVKDLCILFNAIIESIPNFPLNTNHVVNFADLLRHKAKIRMAEYQTSPG